MSVANDFSVIALTPLEFPDVPLVLALSRTDALAVLDTGRDVAAGLDAVRTLVERSLHRFAVLPRFPFDTAELPPDCTVILPGPDYPVERWQPRRVIAQVTSLDEAAAAIAAGAQGLIAKGSESGGRVGDEGAFVLLQRLANRYPVPIWVQGGIGPDTAAACVAGGAVGVVLDVQLALVRESTLPDPVKQLIAQMDGGETVVEGGCRVYRRLGGSPLGARKNIPAPDSEGSRSTLGALSVGQDGAFAAGLAERFLTAGRIVRAVEQAMTESVRLARQVQPIAENNALAQAHRVRYPVLQGPMTRVSDVPEFAEAVAQAGGLPFVALSVLRGEAARHLLEATRDSLGGQTWGVGILGFVDAELREEQIEAIRAVRPPAALIAGGRPSQARALENLGIATYLHVPSPGLLKLFLADGARRFVFEGRECGGHVGPRTSFALWQSQIDELMKFPRPTELSVVFAGGIHDTRSAAMVSAMAAPLAAKGAKIGILMGTAYLFTEEAVASGAILPTYQKAALDCAQTMLLETAPGHVTRCVDTPFVQTFRSERERLEREGMDAKAIWAHLEELNLGRLRIASKGVVRDGANLVQVGEQDQYAQGMYMIGDVATMHGEIMRAEDLHASVTRDVVTYLDEIAMPVSSAEPAAPAEIAIVGIAGAFPGADDVETFWSNVVNGRSAISEVDPARWNPEHYFDPDSQSGDRTPSKWGGFLGDILFDPLEYGIPPQSLTSIDPAQLLSLEVARRALEDAGYHGRPFDRSRVSVIFGAEAGADLSVAYGFRALYPQLAGELPPELDAHLPRLTEDSFPGVLSNVIAGRIANRLDLGGVNYSVDAACASSLAALDLAVKELSLRTSDMVLCGGVDLHNGINDYLLFSGVHALSRKGLCRTFDAGADGTVLGEGVACVVLKRLADAERDGDRIYAVIRSVAGSSDGRSLGLTAPRKEGQMRAVERAYARAGMSPRGITLVEAHGTGTVVGDRTELGTLTEVFSDAGVAAGRCSLGSVKSQIGHTKCAAGLASVIKVAKALYHRVLPPTLNIEQPNPAYDPLSSPFSLSRIARPWVERERHAGVSAFGFGGANFHALLSAYEPDQPPPIALAELPAELFLLRGSDAGAALARARAMLALLDSDPPPNLRDLAAAVTTKESGQPVQFAFVAGSTDELRDRIRGMLGAAEDDPAVFRARPLGGEIAFLFPGQGSQRVNMLRDLFVTFPHLHRLLTVEGDWRDSLFPPEAWTDDQRSRQEATIRDTRVAQPALGIAGLALADLLGRSGVRAQMMGGHSYGELVALCVSGCFSERELIALSRERAESIVQAAGSHPGTMAAVALGSADLRPYLEEAEGVVAANLNAPEQTVISGSEQGVARVLERLQAAGVAAKILPVAAAFHSPVVAAAADSLGRYLATVALAAPREPVWSNATAAPYPTDATSVGEYLSEHVRQPVRFVDLVQGMHGNGARIFIEVGPGQVLSGLVERILRGQEHAVVAMDRYRDAGLRGFLTALAELAALGVDVCADWLFEGRGVRALDLAHPRAVSPTAWKVNGWLARPVHGEAPKNRLRPAPQPVFIGHSPSAQPAGGDDVAVLAYLENLRELATAQRDVMLGYFGSEPGRPRVLRPVLQAEAAVAAPDSLEVSTSRPAVARPVAAERSIEDILLGVVSDKTGYPREMLGLDQDLEAELSIDSIKRVEILGALAEALAFDDVSGSGRDYMIEQLAAQKTLRAIVSWLREHQGDSPAASAASGSVPAPEAPDARDILLRLVSEKTGYPAELLDVNQDLEADLSIDSIKRVEILGALAGELGLGAQATGHDQDYVIEQLAARKTLGEILTWINAQGSRDDPDAGPLQAPSAEGSSAAQGSSDRMAGTPMYLRRFVPRVTQAIRSGHRSMNLQGKRIFITEAEHPLAVELQSLLQARGALVDLASFGAADGSGHDWVLFLGGLRKANGTDPVKELFELTKAALAGGVSGVIGVTPGGGRFDPIVGRGHGAGVPGLLKAIAKEKPKLRATVIDINPDDPVRVSAESIVAELEQGTESVEVGYSGGKRFRREMVPTDIPDVSDHELPLDTESVVLLTGGARGITAAAAVEIARRSRCRLVLVGRSAPPSGPVPYASATAGRRALREELIREGRLKDPRAIEAECQRLLADHEIHTTLETLRGFGARVEYHALDVRDAHGFAALIDDLYQRFGRIDGVIHGAGVIEDRLIGDKDRESFDRVFDTKIIPAQVLADRLRNDARFVVFFSSVSGVFGNQGQSDYAAAGDFLDQLAWRLRERISGKVISIDWGPWAGVGMVSEELARQYAARGVGLIDVSEGVDALLCEIASPGKGDAQVMWMVADPGAFATVAEAAA